MSEPATKILEARSLDDRTAFETMRQAIRFGQFTPFLGAGASSLRPHRPNLVEYPWNEIWNIILAIRDGLDKPSQLLYLQSFAVQRLRIDEESKRELEPLPERMLRRESVRASTRGKWPQQDFIDFQITLVRFAAELGEVFGEAFSKSYTAVTRINELEATIDPSSTVSTDLIGELLHLVDLAQLLPEDAIPPKALVRGLVQPPSLKKQDIYKKLFMMTIRLTNDDLWNSDRLSGWKERHAGIHETFPSDLSKPRKGEVAIGIEMLEWLPELFWYTLRYWTPLLPTTGEMAFDLSLSAFLAPPVKVDLAQAAEALKLPAKQLAADVKKWFDYCHSRQVKPSRFHVAIAAVLQHMYDMYILREKSRSAGDSERPAAESNGSIYLPVAFTTNFDRLLEQVFEFFDITYHVVYPLRPRKSRPSGGEAKIQWKFCTRYSRRATDTSFRPDFSCDELFLDESNQEILAGPVIVKLHGSPLDSNYDSEHWLVLSELGYLEALDQKHCQLPVWLERQLAGESEYGDQEEGRSLWFLGYSITDWNVRLRIYEHLRHNQQLRGSSRRAVDRKLDSFRMAILGSLAIELYVGDLNVLPRMILGALSEISTSSRSAELERLVAWLDEEAR